MIQQNNKNDGGGNTRLIPTTALSVHLDYLRVKITCIESQVEEVFSFIGHKYISVEMDSPWTAGTGCTYYENKIITPIGVSGGFTVDSETGDVEMMVQFSGEYFSAISMLDSWRLIMGLYHKFSADCSRIDIAIDDPSYSIIPVDKMYQAWVDGNNFGFRKYKDCGSGLTPETYTKTHYFGSRESGKLVRIYDHKQKCMRFEVEFKRQYSRLLFLLMASIERNVQVIPGEPEDHSINHMDAYKKCVDILGSSIQFSGYEISFEELHACKGDFDLLLQKIFGGIAVSCIDFRDKSGLKDPARASRRDTKRLDWYQEFMDRIGLEIKVKLPKRECSMRKNVAWMQRSVSKSLLIIKKSLGLSEFAVWMSDLTSSAKEKITSADEKKIEFCKNNKDLLRLSYV